MESKIRQEGSIHVNVLILMVGYVLMLVCRKCLKCPESFGTSFTTYFQIFRKVAVYISSVTEIFFKKFKL